MFISCTLPLQTPLIKHHFTHYYVDQNKQTEYHTFPIKILIRVYIQQNQKGYSTSQIGTIMNVLDHKKVDHL